MRYLVAFLAFLLTSCLSMPLPDTGSPDQVEPTLKPNLAFTLDGAPKLGAVVAQRQSATKIGINLPQDTQLVLVSSCGRFHDFWYPDTKKTWFYTYTPAIDTEAFKSCVTYLTVVTVKGEWYRGIIDWTNSPGQPAKADVTCDSNQLLDVEGNAICSIHAGIPVVISSRTPAVLARDPDSPCPDPVERTHLRSWEITRAAPQPGESALCIYILKNQKKEKFRLTLHTYTSILRVFPPRK
jgi:hypothetical protein